MSEQDRIQVRDRRLLRSNRAPRAYNTSQRQWIIQARTQQRGSHGASCTCEHELCQQKMPNCQQFLRHVVSSNPHDDPRLDFCSPQFDPLLALYAADISIPVPNIRPLDNIASFAAKFGVSTIASFLMMIPPSIGSAVRRSKPQINPCRSLLQLHMCQLRPKRSATQPVTIVTSRKPPSTSATTNPCHRFQQTSKEPHTHLAIMLSRCPQIHLSMQQLARSRVVRLVV